MALRISFWKIGRIGAPPPGWCQPLHYIPLLHCIYTGTGTKWGFYRSPSISKNNEILWLHFPKADFFVFLRRVRSRIMPLFGSKNFFFENWPYWSPPWRLVPATPLYTRFTLDLHRECLKRGVLWSPSISKSGEKSWMPFSPERFLSLL